MCRLLLLLFISKWRQSLGAECRQHTASVFAPTRCVHVKKKKSQVKIANRSFKAVNPNMGIRRKNEGFFWFDNDGGL